MYIQSIVLLHCYISNISKLECLERALDATFCSLSFIPLSSELCFLKCFLSIKFTVRDLTHVHWIHFLWSLKIYIPAIAVFHWHAHWVNLINFCHFPVNLCVDLQLIHFHMQMQYRRKDLQYLSTLLALATYRPCVSQEM